MTVDVSVVVPSIGSSGEVHGQRRVFVLEAVRSVLATTTSITREIVVVAGRDMPHEIVDQLCELDPGAVRCVPYDAEFNFSATVNLGAAHAVGRHLLLLNDDTEATSNGWLELMLDALAVPGVGAVGARLLFEDGTLQHAGHTYRGALGHVAFGLPGDAPGRNGVLLQRRSVAGVTAACMLTPATVYDEVGGFTTLLPGNYNDVDYCMKLRHAGYDVVYEPGAVLYHFESRSRITGIKPFEIDLIDRRWRSRAAADPFSPADL